MARIGLQPVPPEQCVQRFSRLQFIAAGGVCVGSLLVYLLTMYPDVAGGDSGEIVAAAVSGGVIHPPGYPLYSLLAKLFVHFPLRTIAWRMGLMSAVCNAAAAGLLCLGVGRWSRSSWAGVAAAGLFALSPGIWEYAICAEVFALNNLIVASLVLLAVFYANIKNPRYAHAGALVFGLGISNHHTIVFVGVPLAAWVLWHGRGELLKPRSLMLVAALFLAGLLPYLYLPWAGSRAAAVSWGATDTWAGLWTHVLRREYGTFQLAVNGVGSQVSSSDLIATWLRDLLNQIGWWGLGLAIVGFLASIYGGVRPSPHQANLDGAPLPPRGREASRLALCARVLPAPSIPQPAICCRHALGPAIMVALALSVLAFAGLANLPVNDPLHRAIVARFWQQPEILVCAFCGLGLATLDLAFRGHAVVPGLAVCLITLQGAFHWRHLDRHDSRLVRHYADEMLRVAPRNSLLATKGDLITNTIRYLQVAELQRPDVRVVDQELLGYPWYPARLAALYPDVIIPGIRLGPGGFSVKDLFDANIRRFPIMVCGGLKAGDTSASATYDLWPLGVCERVHTRSEPFDTDNWLSESEKALPRIELPRQSDGSWEEIVSKDHWGARQTRAAQLINYAGALPERRPYLRLAADMLDALVRDAPAPPALAYKTLAIAIGRAGLQTSEDKQRAAAAWRAYLQVAPDDDPMLSMIRNELERLAQ
jgi:hypothetical protein